MELIFIVAWMFSFFLTISLFLIVLYQRMCLIDLKDDYTNPHDTAARVNNVVRIEYFTQGLVCYIHLVTRHWFTLLLCLPYIYYNIHFVHKTKAYSGCNRNMHAAAPGNEATVI